MKINPRGYWENDTVEGHGHDENLAIGLFNFFKKNKPLNSKVIRIADLGCGDAYYTNFLSKCNCIIVDAYDGNPFTPQITNGIGKVLDLSSPMYIGKYDWVLSLEVGEHIPRQYENIFINNIVNTARLGIVLSWAVPLQGGDGHVNCRDNLYIERRFKELGFVLDMIHTDYLRDKASKYPNTGWWFKNTLMVFKPYPPVNYV